MALPYTLDLAGTSQGSIPVGGFGDFGTGTWSGTLPAARTVADADQDISLEVRGAGAGNPGIYIRVGAGSSGGQDFVDELEAARLKIQNADGSVTYWQGVLRTIDAIEPYIWNPGDVVVSPILAGQGSGASTLRLRFEQASDPVHADPGTVAAGEPSAALQATVVEDPVHADPGTVATAAPAATLQAAGAEDPVHADPGTVAAAAPAAELQATVVSAVPVHADPGIVATAAPAATARAQRRDVTARNADLGTVATAAPSATLQAAPAEDPVHADPGTVATAAPVAALQATVVEDPVHADPGTVATAAPAATLQAEIRTQPPMPVHADPGRVAAAAPRAALTAAIGEQLGGFTVAERATAPTQRILTAIELDHASASSPRRMVNDGRAWTIGGRRFEAARFEAVLVDDEESRAPQAEVRIANTGRALVEWIDSVGGGVGVTVRALQALAVDNAAVEWELTMDVVGVSIRTNLVHVRLGFDPLLGRPAVETRYDPQAAPGLF
ncbi:MAG: DUF1833 domain-containing protein [Alphaproteobacteria bacterium]|nr:DUF1833 domain-containing protein [Alphaproteobacteria bacterium]